LALPEPLLDFPEPSPELESSSNVFLNENLLRLQKVNLLTSLILATAFIITAYTMGFICGSLNRIESKLNVIMSISRQQSGGNQITTVEENLPENASNISDDLEKTRRILEQAEQIFAPTTGKK